MRTFTTGGHKFVMLERGESEPNPYAYGEFNGMTIVWPTDDGVWNVREFNKGEWLEITDQHFDSENAAFNFAYERYCERWERIHCRD